MHPPPRPVLDGGHPRVTHNLSVSQFYGNVREPAKSHAHAPSQFSASTEQRSYHSEQRSFHSDLVSHQGHPHSSYRESPPAPATSFNKPLFTSTSSQRSQDTDTRPPINTILQTEQTKDNCSEITTTPAIRGRLPHDFFPPAAKSITNELCVQNWDYAHIFDIMLRDKPCPDVTDFAAIEPYKTRLLRFRESIHQKLDEGLVKVLLGICTDNNLPTPPKQQKPSDIAGHVLECCPFYDVDKGVINKVNLSLILTCSIVVYTHNTSWVSDCIRKIEEDYKVTIEHEQSLGGNFIYRILESMRFNSADTMRGRMVRRFGIGWYEKRPKSTDKLFGKDAAVESGDKLEIHCGSSRLNGYLYRKTGMKVTDPSTSVEYKLGTHIRKLLQGNEEGTFQRAMSTMWKVCLSIHVEFIPLHVFSYLCDNNFTYYKERSSILQDVGLPSAAPKEVLKSGIKLASNLPTLKSDNKNDKKDGEHSDANQFTEQPQIALPREHAKYLRGFQQTAHITETGGALSHATKPTSITETPEVEFHGQAKDRLAEIPVNPSYNASRRLSGVADSNATKPTSKNKMSVATTKGASKPTSKREKKGAGKGKKPRKRPRTGKKGKGKQNERGKKKHNEEISESESSDDSYEELKRSKKSHQESYKEGLASVFGGEEDEFSTDSWDVGSQVEGECKVRDVVAADYCSLEQKPMLLCMWKGYTAEEYMSWEPLQTIRKEQKHRRE